MSSAIYGIYAVGTLMVLILGAAFYERFKKRRNETFSFNALLADTAGISGSLSALVIAVLLNSLAETRQVEAENREVKRFKDKATKAIAAELYSQGMLLSKYAEMHRRAMEANDPNQTVYPEGYTAFISSRPMFESAKPRLIELDRKVRDAIINYEARYSTALINLQDIADLSVIQVQQHINLAATAAFYYHCELYRAVLSSLCEPEKLLESAHASAVKELDKIKAS